MGVASGAGAPVRKVVGSRLKFPRIHRTTAKVVREFRHVDGGGNQRAAIFHRRKARKRTEIRKRKSLRVNSRIRARRFEFEFDREGGSELGVGRGAVARIFGEIADQEALKRKLLPRALSVGTVFASWLTAQTTELKWLCVFALLALVVFDSTKENDVKTDTAYVLMPLIDAFNHQTMLKTEFEFTNSEFALKSPKSYKKNEEVLISYGLMPNDELLLRYGFVDDQNVADTYQFEGLLPYLTQNDPALKENLEKNPKRIEALRFIPEGSLEQLTLEDAAWRGALVSDGTAEPNLSWALRCLYATESEWTNAGGSCDGFRLGGGQTEKKASLGLKMACEHRLQEMETTYNQDQGLLKEKGEGNWKMRQAILYRMRKKKILSDAVKRYSV